MKDPFKELLQITDRLHEPDGCPWDREQTFESLKPYILEEAHEALEAIEEGDDAKMIEELGDLFYTVIFYAKVAEKSGRFNINDILETLCAKMVRRHPHVFGKESAKTADEVIHHWDRVKKEEGKGRESVLDGIPKTLPSLKRAQKVFKRMQKSHYPVQPEKGSDPITAALLKVVSEASEKGIDLEETFRSLLQKEEAKFREWEKQNIK